MVMARMAGLRPGTSPPPVRMAMVFCDLVMVCKASNNGPLARERSHTGRTHLPHRRTNRSLPPQRTGIVSETFDTTVVDGTRLGVRYGLSMFVISRRSMWPASALHRLPYV